MENDVDLAFYFRSGTISPAVHRYGGLRYFSCCSTLNLITSSPSGLPKKSFCHHGLVP